MRVIVEKEFDDQYVLTNVDTDTEIDTGEIVGKTLKSVKWDRLSGAPVLEFE